MTAQRRTRSELDIKSLKGAAEEKLGLLAELHKAKELHMTLGEAVEMTYQELWVWVTYFGLMNDEREEQMKKSQRRRR